VSTIYHDQDADLETLAGKTLAVIGYGNQGRSQALNLRDSGLRVVVGNVGDESLARARDEGFEATPIAEACARADAILLLVPDEVMPGVYERDVAPSLRSGDLLDFASGYNIAFGLIRPPADVDVVMVAPRMIGPGVRDAYTDGRGFPSFVGVHQDASGQARQRMLALAKGLGSTRAGCIEMSFRDEACLDLFTEQGFGPAFGRVLTTAVETLVDAGFPPEAVLLELYLSGDRRTRLHVREDPRGGAAASDGLPLAHEPIRLDHALRPLCPPRRAAARAHARSPRGHPLGTLRRGVEWPAGHRPGDLREDPRGT
jgi:ketol-acid reductoisomerase